MRKNTALEEIIFPPLPQLLSIGDNFLEGCSNLKRVTFTPVGPCFMLGSSQLVELSLEFYRHNGATTLPDYFLEDCSSLTELDVSPLCATTHVEHNVFCNCASLVSLDLSSWDALVEIGDLFAEGCERLETVHLPCTSRMTTIGGCFLSCCSMLNEVLVPPALNAPESITNVGHCFLNDCPELRTINLNFLKGVVGVRSNFLAGCVSLTALDRMPLANLEVIGDGFVEGCKSLECIDLTCFTKVKTVGSDFLARCTSLAWVDLRPLQNARFGWSMLCGCSEEALKTILVPKKSEKYLVTAAIVGHLPLNLRHHSVIECDLLDDGGSAVPQLPWSWKYHARHPEGVQLAVLWLFSGLLHCQHTDGTPRCVPAEVAHEICQYIGSPYSGLLACKSNAFSAKSKFVFRVNKKA